MKRMFTVVLGLVIISTGWVWAGSRDALWSQVEDARNYGLPQTAISVLEQIIPLAIDDETYAEAVKAIAFKVVFQAQIQGGWAEEKVSRMQVELDQAPAVMQPAMRAILAHWFWQYFQENRWRLLQRTTTSEPAGEDFRTWDIAILLAAMDNLFEQALAAETQLKNTPIGEYDDLLEVGTVPDDTRPTLYDFLVYDALAFYNAAEQAASQPQDAFVIMADSPVFGTMEEFLAWEPNDSDSAQVKAIHLYQALLTIHQNESDPNALLDADLHRLRFGYNQAVGSDKEARYAAALEHFVDQWRSHDIASEALVEWATLVRSQGDAVQARTLALQGYYLHPGSYGSKRCFNLVHEIEARSASVYCERVWNEPWPDIEVVYRNVTRVYFRLVSYDALKNGHFTWGSLNQSEHDAILNASPTRAWQADLPATTDYQDHSQRLAVPTDLSSGFYFLIASFDPSFKSPDNQINVEPIWVSNLALVGRRVSQEGVIEGLVLNARGGEPRTDATVTRWIYQSSLHRYQAGPQTHTDQNGIFSFSGAGSSSLLVAQVKGQTLATESTYNTGPAANDPMPVEKTVFFTDRSLYRPGQTIQYKGICLRLDTVKNHYQTLPQQSLTVVFYDTTGQEISRRVHQCNDYGSFSGSFTAPDDRLTGVMSLSVLAGGPSGSTTVRVEEYQRPQFHVDLEAPAAAPRLNDEVVTPGRATSYTGAVIGGAAVQWRVERQVRFPVWCWWGRRLYPAPTPQLIAYGTTSTRADGTFSIPFTAVPELSISPDSEPVFIFTVHVDVTDTTGETRSQGIQIQVGYTALEAEVTADEWQTLDAPVDLTVTTKSLDGTPEPAAGTVQVYRLQQPDQTARKRWSGSGASDSTDYDPSDPNTWPLGSIVYETAFQTESTGRTTMAVSLPAGIYRVLLQTQDRFGTDVTARHTLTVLDPSASHFEIHLANIVVSPAWSLEPGEVFTAWWGTGYPQGRAFIEIECHGELLRAWWTDDRATQVSWEVPVTERMRGGFTIRVTYSRENRAYISEHIVDVPWTNQQLSVQWEHFRSRLEPGQSEQWTAVVTGPNALGATAEMAACLYDASLDQLWPHQWIDSLSGFRQESSRLTSHFENALTRMPTIVWDWGIETLSTSHTYRRWLPFITSDNFSAVGGIWDMGGGARNGSEVPGKSEQTAESSNTTNINLDQVSLRTNLDETAFFYPHLRSDDDGEVRIEFTVPEALTSWRFLGFAHDNQMRSGGLTDLTVTAKDLMVQPNPPRFVREGDVIEFTVKVSNQSAARQTGQVRLSLLDARTRDNRDQAVGNGTPEKTFDVPSMESRTLSWRLTIPDGGGMLVYRAVGSTGRLSDGEEGGLPVLSRRVLVTESLPLPIRGAQTKNFEFIKLLQSGASDTLINQSLTVQMVSQPAWVAVMALPYLMETPYACSTNRFNQLYANSLAAMIANSDPEIRRIFDLWKNTDALDSPLEQNEDLKAIVLEETPWLHQAVSESQARKQVGILFDRNRLSDEISRMQFQLDQMQYSSGLWPWCPGGQPSEVVTLSIVTGYGRLRHLGVTSLDLSAAVKALNALDQWMDQRYRWILAQDDPNANHLDASAAYYLYGRSFFLSDQPVAASYQTALAYWQDQARTYWLSLSRQSQAHIALGLKRFGDLTTPSDIMASLLQRSLLDDEMGRYWRDSDHTWWWYQAPIETQAMMIEAFDEVAGDANTVEECCVWLLKQKQTEDWGTTRATADAIYALLLRGVNWLGSHDLVDVALNGQWIEPQYVEPGTGFYETRFLGSQIEPALGHITVHKTDDGISWGSVNWQYLEDLSKVTPYEGTPLQLQKDLYVKTNTSQGQVLVPVFGPLHVGDELVTRITLRVDRDMEYLHMKDQRASGTEPLDALSGYHWQGGLGYYQSVHDTATHFFMDTISAGTYVFEYSTRVEHKGIYQSGITSIQCLYAPEFNSHSQSVALTVE